MSRRITSEFGTLAERTQKTATGHQPAPEQRLEPLDAEQPDTESLDAGQPAGPRDTSPSTESPNPGIAETTPEDLIAAARLQDPVHVWVDGRCAGLLLAWSQGPDRTWWGRVFWCPPDVPEAVLDWITQQRLHPVTS